MANLDDIYKKDLQFVISKIKNKNFSSAKKEIEKLINKDPDNKKLQMLYGDCLIGMGKFVLARGRFIDCLTEKELRNMCYSKIAWISEKLEESSQALFYYKKALELNPKNSRILNRLGNLHRKNNAYSEAIRCYDEAIRAEPKNTIARTNKGLVKHIQGEYSESIKILNEVLLIDKNNLPAIKALANGYMKTGNFTNSFSHLEKALILAPGDLGITIQIAEASKRLRKYELAIKFLSELIKTNPDYIPAYISLSGVYRQQKNFSLCVDISKKALTLDPKGKATINNLGVAYSGNGDHSKAISLYKKAIKLYPKDYIIITYLGMAYAFTGQYRKAIPILEEAVKIKKSYSEAHYGLGKVYVETGSYAKSIESFKTACDLKPSNIEAVKYMVHPLMYSYKFTDAWQQYEYRWLVTEGEANREKKWPLPKTKIWAREKCKRLLLWREQGIGDDVLALGLIPEAQNLAKSLIIYSDKKLIPLCKRSFPEITFKEYVKPIKEKKYNFHLPMGSLPRLFRQSEDDFKKTKRSYLKADPERVKAITSELGLEGKKVIGISWKSIKSLNTLKKSLTLLEFGAIFEGLDVTLVNLQYGDVNREINEFEEETGIKIVQCGSVDNREDLDGLAALIEACDLVVSTSNVTIHLAGALGKDTWVLLPFVSSFWWLLNRDDSVWYPSIKIYRQKKFGDWKFAINFLRNELCSKFSLI